MKKKPLVIGHRGCRNLRPENSLSAFKHAFDLGVDAIEFDIHLTKDGRLVAYHDYLLNPNLTRTTDGAWIKDPYPPIHLQTFSEIRAFKMGKIKPFSFYSFMHHPAQNAEDQAIPSLEDVFELAKLYTHPKLLIEVKTTPIEPDLSSDPQLISEAVVKAINQSGIKNRCIILAFDVRVVQHIRRIEPKLMIMLNQQHTSHSNSPWYGGYDLKDLGNSPAALAKEIGANGWSTYHRQLNADNIKQAHALDLQVFAWTVNSRRQIRKLKEMDVDGIISDRPDILLEK